MANCRNPKEKSWYIYKPHWIVGPGDEAGICPIVSSQATYLKASTALSWESPPESSRRVPPNQELRACLCEVICPRERVRHDGSKDHSQVELTPRSSALLEVLDQWYIYWPHWRPGVTGKLEANHDTWLKRSWQRSSQLAAHEKIGVAAGEVLAILDMHLLSTASTPLEAEHRIVNVAPAELSRLGAAAPRQPVCRYFSRSPDALLAEIRSCFSDTVFGPGAMLADVESLVGVDESFGSNRPAESSGNNRPPFALLLPHGGYCNSGFVAAHGFKLLADASSTAPIAVIIGNNHASWHKVALCDQVWSTPLGPVFPDQDAVRELEAAGLPVDRSVHANEHSIENQLPFFRHVCPGARIVPLGVGAVSLEEAAQLAMVLAELVSRRGAVLLGTTDFSHEGPSYGGPAMSMEEVTALTRRKDSPLLEAVQQMDAARLLELGRSSSMCGAGAASVLLLTCRSLGLTDAKMLRYLVNTEVTPCGSTTGFASFAFTAPAEDKSTERQ